MLLSEIPPLLLETLFLFLSMFDLSRTHKSNTLSNSSTGSIRLSLTKSLRTIPISSPSLSPSVRSRSTCFGLTMGRSRSWKGEISRGLRSTNLGSRLRPSSFNKISNSLSVIPVSTESQTFPPCISSPSGTRLPSLERRPELFFLLGCPSLEMELILTGQTLHSLGTNGDTCDKFRRETRTAKS